MWAAPCTSAIVAGGAIVVKEKAKSAAGESGGSITSWSETPAAKIVTVHDSALAKSVGGIERERSSGRRTRPR